MAFFVHLGRFRNSEKKNCTTPYDYQVRLGNWRVHNGKTLYERFPSGGGCGEEGFRDR